MRKWDTVNELKPMFGVRKYHNESLTIMEQEIYSCFYKNENMYGLLMATNSVYTGDYW